MCGARKRDFVAVRGLEPRGQEEGQVQGRGRAGRSSRAAGSLGVRKLLNGLAGSKLCYGEPVRSGDHVVIPVARVRAAGGGGFGNGDGADRRRRSQRRQRGGGGGHVDAAPVGFIDIGPEGARFEAIPDPITTARALTTAVATLLGARSACARFAAAAKALPAAAPAATPRQ